MSMVMIDVQTHTNQEPLTVLQYFVSMQTITRNVIINTDQTISPGIIEDATNAIYDNSLISGWGVNGISTWGNPGLGGITTLKFNNYLYRLTYIGAYNFYGHFIDTYGNIIPTPYPTISSLTSFETGYMQLNYPGLIANWDFSDLQSYSGSGTILNDLSGENNTLTFSATPTFNITPPSVSFTSTLSATSATAKTVYNFRANGLTLEVLFNRNGNQSTFSQLLSLFNSSSTYNSSYRANIANTATVAYFGVAANQFAFTNTNGNKPIPSNGWTHFVITCSPWTGATATINTYLNKTNTCTNEAQNTSYFDATNISYFFGLGSVATLSGFVGNIAIARVYNRPLTASEITSNYNEIKAKTGNPYGLA